MQNPLSLETSSSLLLMLFGTQKQFEGSAGPLEFNLERLKQRYREVTPPGTRYVVRQAYW
jgi:hypothetical protein